MSEENKELQTPQEVTLCYTHPSQQPQEVVCCYEQPTPMPGKRYREVNAPDTGVWQEAARREKRHRRWPWLVALGVLFVIAAIIFIALRPDHDDIPSSDEDSASSIVDIFADKETTIPRYESDGSMRLTCHTERGDELNATQVYEKVMPSVVTVVASMDKYSCIGTGIIMSEDGYILTNAHVISGGEECWIAPYDDGTVYEAQLVGYDEEIDLAVLKAVDAKDFVSAEFGDSELAQVGEKVYAIGNPLGLELRGTLTDGIISAINRDVTVDGKTMTVIQTNAALNNGNSGGPLINAYGQVIGVNTLKMSRNSITEATVEGLGFALPISTMSFVVNDIIASGSFHGYPTIGFTVFNADDEDGLSHVEVLEVSEGFGAEKAGIKPGDIILAADGQELSVTADLLTVRRNHTIGDEMVLTVLRDGKTFDVSVTLMANK